MAENLENLLKEIFVLESLVKKLTSQLQGLEDKIYNKEAEIDKISSRVSKTRADNIILNHSIIELTVQLDLIDQSIEQLNKKFLTCEPKKEDILTKINAIQTEITSQIRHFDSIYKNLVSKHNSNLEKMCIEFKQNTIKFKLEFINRLETEIKNLENFKNFVSELSYLESELLLLSETETNLSKELEKLESKENELTEELNRLENNSSYLESDEETENLKSELKKLNDYDNDEFVMLNKKYRYLRNQFNERKNNK